MPTRFVNWPQAWRIIASRYPPIDLYERLTPDPAIWEALIALEQMTNPRVRDQLGEISLVAQEERLNGPGASYVMACFTHLNPKGSRFSDGTYGVYYAAATLETAVAETLHHFEAFARAANDPPHEEEMRVLVSAVSTTMEDVSQFPQAEQTRILDAGSYAASLPFAKTLRKTASQGIVYPSVRHPSGECLAAFKPKAITLPVIQERHLRYHWNGTRVDRYFDYYVSKWIKKLPG